MNVGIIVSFVVISSFLHLGLQLGVYEFFAVLLIVTRIHTLVFSLLQAFFSSLGHRDYAVSSRQESIH